MMVTQSKAIEALLSKTEKEKQTNFQRISASPEALAEFICDVSFYFPWDDSEFCCRYDIETEQDRLNFVREWLKGESK